MCADRSNKSAHSSRVGAFCRNFRLLIHADEAFEPVDIGFAVDHVGIVDDEQIVDALLGSELLEIE